MTKKICETIGLAGAVFVLSGCQFSDAISEAIYAPVLQTNVVQSSTGPAIPIVSTNWVVKPSVEAGVRTVGAISPWPYSSLISSGIVGVLGFFAHIKGRKWKKAALSAVMAADEFKGELQKINPEVAQRAKSKVRTEQKISKTQPLIQEALSLLGK